MAKKNVEAVEKKIIGKASATQNDPSSSEKFAFWLAPEEIVNPFDIVEANQMQGTRTFGLVTNIKQVTDAPSHLSNYISSDFGSTASEAQTPRQGFRDSTGLSLDAESGIPASRSVRQA